MINFRNILLHIHQIIKHNMALEQQIMAEMKDAMKSKNEAVLRSLTCN